LAAFDYFSGLPRACRDRDHQGHHDLHHGVRSRDRHSLEVGGWGKVFSAVPPEKLLLPDNLGAYTGYGTLFLGSAMALFSIPIR